MGWPEWIRSATVEPSLYAANFADLGAQVRSLLQAGARVFHVDIGDGHFVGPITIGPVVVKDIAPIVHEVGGALDCHLMVSNPERHFAQLAEAGADSVTFHVEVTDDVPRMTALARAEGLSVGLAFSPETPVALAAEAAAGVDLVLCMSVHPGYSGQQFLPQSLDRIRELRRLLPQKLIQVDGGLSLDNARSVREAGADLLVAGSAIFSGGDLPHPYLRLVRAFA